MAGILTFPNQFSNLISLSFELSGSESLRERLPSARMGDPSAPEPKVARVECQSRTTRQTAAWVELRLGRPTEWKSRKLNPRSAHPATRAHNGLMMRLSADNPCSEAVARLKVRSDSMPRVSECRHEPAGKRPKNERSGERKGRGISGGIMKLDDKICYTVMILALAYLIVQVALALSRHAQALGIYWR